MLTKLSSKWLGHSEGHLVLLTRDFVGFLNEHSLPRMRFSFACCFSGKTIRFATEGPSGVPAVMLFALDLNWFGSSCHFWNRNAAAKAENRM